MTDRKEAEWHQPGGPSTGHPRTQCSNERCGQEPVPYPWDRSEQTPRVLTMQQADLLGQLMRAVQAGVKMRYYPRGSEDADRPMSVVLRAFTCDGGNFFPVDEDIRDAFVWTSGLFEKWFKVDDLLKALDNAVTARYGLDQPMAMIDTEGQ